MAGDVGSSLKPATGAKLISPFTGLTSQTPSPGTVYPIISPSASVCTIVAPAGTTKLTLVTSNVPSASSSIPKPLSAVGSKLTVAPGVLGALTSFCTTGGTLGTAP